MTVRARTELFLDCGRPGVAVGVSVRQGVAEEEVR